MKAFLTRILQSCNPNTYPDLCDEKFASTFKHFLKQFGVLVVVMAVLFVPAYFVHADDIQEKLNSFDEARFDGLFTSSQAIELLESPRVVFDRNATSVTGQATIGSEGIYWRPYYWLGSEFISFDELKDAKTVDNRIIVLMGLFLLPALIFWSSAFILFKALLFIVFFGILGWIIVGALRQSLTFKRAIQVAFYAAVPLLILEMVIFPFWYNAIVSLLVFLTFFGLGLALLSERKLKRKR